MKFIADLHIHSPYSRATSKDMEIENLNRWAQLKGLTVVGTGDFTHPKWLVNLQEKLESAEDGLFRLKPEYESSMVEEVPSSCRRDVRFILSAEISCIYSKNGRTRKVHNLLLVPTFAEAAKINAALSKIGNLKSDGRPILGLDSKVLLNIALDTSPDVLFIPAHAWTPHFSVLGSNSGFDSLEECFEELTSHIYAIETGLSSDPPMNRRLSGLDRVALISNSDAHSPAKLAREANIFDTELSYKGIYIAIKDKDKKGFISTIEFFPEEGKYHFDGHRDCKRRMHPSDTRQNNGLCPKCGKKVTIGVMHRVDDLADRDESNIPAGKIPFKRLIPLAEIIAEVTGVGVNSKVVKNTYNKLLAALGDELSILQDSTIEDITKAGTPLLGEAILRVREGRVSIAPGYDGEYGIIKIIENGKKTNHKI
ncbi:MAG: DNA helicase UvrD [Nitrospirae bacterium GWA2_42_11]|nr:MAG: DNA helicase UvrD [Nitrospirae bacterium GWA2_42_11]